MAANTKKKTALFKVWFHKYETLKSRSSLLETVIGTVLVLLSGNAFFINKFRNCSTDVIVIRLTTGE